MVILVKYARIEQFKSTNDVTAISVHPQLIYLEERVYIICFRFSHKTNYVSYLRLKCSFTEPCVPQQVNYWLIEKHNKIIIFSRNSIQRRKIYIFVRNPQSHWAPRPFGMSYVVCANIVETKVIFRINCERVCCGTKWLLYTHVFRYSSPSAFVWRLVDVDLRICYWFVSDYRRSYVNVLHWKQETFRWRALNETEPKNRLKKDLPGCDE